MTVSAGVLALALAWGGCESSRPAARPTSDTRTVAPRLVRLVGVYRLLPELMTAASGRFFGVLATRSDASVAVVRIDRRGAVVRRTLSDPVASYFFSVAAGSRALFVATRVIKKFTDAPDEVLRLDASTLKPTARTSLSSSVVALVAGPDDLWVALADRILRLDPVSLRVEASFRIPGAVPPPVGSSSISSLARGPGGLWATFGDSKHTLLYRLDPVSLAVRGRVAVPESGQGIGVVAGPELTWLTGEDFARWVESSGRLDKPFPLPGLEAAAARGRDLLALSASGLVEVNPRGAVVARSDVRHAGALLGAPLAVDGRNLWLLDGRLLAHFVLIGPPVHRVAEPGPMIHEALGGNGIGAVDFGVSPAQVIARLTPLLGRPASFYEAGGACNYDHTIKWPGLTVNFERSRFVGYSYGTLSRPRRPRHGLMLATARGLRVGDTMIRGKSLYGPAFGFGPANGGSWVARTAHGTIEGFTWNIPKRGVLVGPGSIIATVEAGNVGCPAMTP